MGSKVLLRKLWDSRLYTKDHYGLSIPKLLERNQKNQGQENSPADTFWISKIHPAHCRALTTLSKSKEIFGFSHCPQKLISLEIWMLLADSVLYQHPKFHGSTQGLSTAVLQAQRMTFGSSFGQSLQGLLPLHSRGCKCTTWRNRMHAPQTGRTSTNGSTMCLNGPSPIRKNQILRPGRHALGRLFRPKWTWCSQHRASMTCASCFPSTLAMKTPKLIRAQPA